MKVLGTLNYELLHPGTMQFSKDLLVHLGMTEIQIVDLVEQVREELGVGRIYTPVRIVWARRPIGESGSGANEAAASST